MYGRGEKSSFFPESGAQWSTTVESTLRVLEIVAPGVAVILGVVLGLAEIAPVSWQLQRAKWWSL